jgi:aryl-alcohol dehydrogenase-like predicted oxidoreductase
MEQRTLGHSGLRVSLAGLGCNNFGQRIGEAESIDVVHAALDAGIRFFDTADVYGGGRSEEFLGRGLGSRRHEAVIATKFGYPTGRGSYPGGASRRQVIAACEQSLRRLATDYIDVYFLHIPDPATPIEETLDAMNRLVVDGKVRYLGCSNFAGWQIADAHGVARDRRLRGFVAAQNEWSLLERGIEREVVPACERFGLGILPYFPLAGGALTGKYRRGATFAEGSRFGTSEARAGKFGRFIADASLARVERLERLAAESGRSLLALALSWLAGQRGVSSVIAGATRRSQVEDNVAATRDDLGAEVFEAVEKVLAEG